LRFVRVEAYARADRRIAVSLNSGEVELVADTGIKALQQPVDPLGQEAEPPAVVIR
jgi:hypothetical protein